MTCARAAELRCKPFRPSNELSSLASGHREGHRYTWQLATPLYLTQIISGVYFQPSGTQNASPRRLSRTARSASVRRPWPLVFLNTKNQTSPDTYMAPGPSILRQVYTSNSLRAKVGLTEPHTGPHKPSLHTSMPLILQRPQLAHTNKALKTTVNLRHFVFHLRCTTRSYNGLLHGHKSTARVVLANASTQTLDM